jgi:hypothetical protein
MVLFFFPALRVVDRFFLNTGKAGCSYRSRIVGICCELQI